MEMDFTSIMGGGKCIVHVFRSSSQDSLGINHSLSSKVQIQVCIVSERARVRRAQRLSFMNA